jgi:hypothetical protein
MRLPSLIHAITINMQEEIIMGHFGNPLTEYSPEMEAFEFEQGFKASPDSVFHEAEEMELAAELLEVSNEQELEQFLGDFIKKAGKAIGGIVKSPIGKAPPRSRCLLPEVRSERL